MTAADARRSPQTSTICDPGNNPGSSLSERACPSKKQARICQGFHLVNQFEPPGTTLLHTTKLSPECSRHAKAPEGCSPGKSQEATCSCLAGPARFIQPYLGTNLAVLSATMWGAECGRLRSRGQYTYFHASVHNTTTKYGHECMHVKRAQTPNVPTNVCF